MNFFSRKPKKPTPPPTFEPAVGGPAPPAMGGVDMTPAAAPPPRAPFGDAGPAPVPAAAAHPGRPQLSEFAYDLYALVYTLRAGQDLGDYGVVRRRIMDSLGEFANHARNAGYTTPVVDTARFALVALLDELVLMSEWTGKAQWASSPMQLELFQTNTAGQEFFVRLSDLRTRFEENRELIEIYHDCLALGFKGKYLLMGGDEREVLVSEMARDLTRGRTFDLEGLSPSWERPDHVGEVVGEGMPVWATLAIFIPLAVIILAVFIVAADREAAGVAEIIASLPGAQR